MKNTQIIHFVSGEKATFFDVVGVKENEFTHIKLADGRLILINKRNVNWLEIMDDNVAKKTFGKMYKVSSANEV